MGRRENWPSSHTDCLFRQSDEHRSHARRCRRSPTVFRLPMPMPRYLLQRGMGSVPNDVDGKSRLVRSSGPQLALFEKMGVYSALGAGPAAYTN